MDVTFNKIMIRALWAQMRIAHFAETGVTGRTDYSYMYSVTNNDLPSKNRFISGANVVTLSRV
jgi:hypothetical protein